MNTHGPKSGWGVEERVPLAVLYGEAAAHARTVEIGIVAHARGFLVVAADGEPCYLFRLRSPMEPGRIKIDADGGARVVGMPSLPAAGVGDSDSDDPSDPGYSKVSSGDARGIGGFCAAPGSAALTPWAAVAAATPRAAPFTHHFRVLARVGTWAFNARCAPLGGGDLIAFHLNPRRAASNGGTVVLNAKLPNWGTEEVLPFNVLFPPTTASDDSVEVGVLVNARGFLVLATDGEAAYTFRHRTPLVLPRLRGETVGVDVALAPATIAASAVL